VTRRILLVLLAFTAIVLVGAVVPLTLNTATHDRSSFIQATAGMVRSDALIAEARIVGSPDGPLISLITQTRLTSDGLLILRGRCPQQSQANSVDMPAGAWGSLACRANNLGRGTPKAAPIQPIIETTGSRVIAAIPVYSNAHVLVGTVVLARSATVLNHEIVELWALLGTIALVAMLAATLLAFALARWVSRPLGALDTAAGRLAEGDLAIRAVVASGPPELRRLGTTFNTMAGRLEALVHGNRAVIADVSHQLRTPLAALRLRLDLLAADTAQSDPDTAHELAGALGELARLSRLVDGLLAVARAENVVPVPMAVDVTEVATERGAAWHPVADDRGITLEIRARPGSTALAWIGEGHLEQVLDNLIANALEALSPGHQVIVTATATASGPQVTVSDNGPGMTAEDRERAFLRFNTSNPNGTGLGLAIVHRLVTSNGGTARLSETPGGGLTITLDFPGVPAANGGNGGAAASGAAASGAADGGSAPNGAAALAL
jgi:signal transduction histidine kinase